MEILNRNITDEEAKNLTFTLDGKKYRLSDLIENEALQKEFLRVADFNAGYQTAKNEIFWKLVNRNRTAAKIIRQKHGPEVAERLMRVYHLILEGTTKPADILKNLGQDGISIDTIYKDKVLLKRYKLIS